MTRRAKHTGKHKPTLKPKSPWRRHHHGRWLKRLFNAWLTMNNSTLAFSVRIQKRTKRRSWQLQLAGVAKEFHFLLDEAGITVSIVKDGECVDLMGDFDAYPEAVAGGYVCSLCEKDSREIYPTIEAFWRTHIFDDFGRWINERLAQAHWLRIAIFGKGSSDACLVNNQEDVEQHSRRFLALFGGLKRLDGSHAFSAEELEHPQIFLVPVRTAVQN